MTPDPQPPAGPQAEVVERLLASTPYAVVRYVGRGGMGAVFEVEHRFLGRRFVVKVLHARLADQPQFVDRMRVEAQAMAQLRHPNVVEVVDFWTADDGRPCVVMELLRGRTLAQALLARRKLPWAEAIDLTRQVLSALSAAHALGIIHRDIKPENLFLHDANGAVPVVKVLDFGVARVLSEASVAPLAIPTDTGAIVGSPRFVSPEGAAGKRVDQRADIYSTGVVAYAMLAGRGPFDGFNHACAEPPSKFADPGVPSGLDAAILRAIEHDADARYQSARDFSEVLGSLAPRTPSTWPR